YAFRRHLYCGTVRYGWIVGSCGTAATRDAKSSGDLSPALEPGSGASYHPPQREHRFRSSTHSIPFMLWAGTLDDQRLHQYFEEEGNIKQHCLYTLSDVSLNILLRS